MQKCGCNYDCAQFAPCNYPAILGQSRFLRTFRMVPTDTGMCLFSPPAAFFFRTKIPPPLVELPMPRCFGWLAAERILEELAHERGLRPPSFGRNGGRRDGSRYAALLLGFAQLVLERRDLPGGLHLARLKRSEHGHLVHSNSRRALSIFSRSPTSRMPACCATKGGESGRGTRNALVASGDRRGGVGALERSTLKGSLGTGSSELGDKGRVGALRTPTAQP